MSLDLVRTIKKQLEVMGVDLSGPCGAFLITERVAWALRATGSGLLDKPSGNNCDGFAVDQLCYPDGRIRDILGDAGGASTPQWPDGDLEIVDASRYRAPHNPDAPVADPPDLPRDDNGAGQSELSRIRFLLERLAAHFGVNLEG